MSRTRSRRNTRKGGEGTERKAMLAAMRLARENKKARVPTPVRDALEELNSLEKRLDMEENGEKFGFPDNTSLRHRRIVANLKPYHPMKWSTPKMKSKSKSKRVSMKQNKPTRLNRFKKWLKGSKAKTINLSKKSSDKVVSNPLLDEIVTEDSIYKKKKYNAPPGSSSSPKKSFGLKSKKFLPSPK